MCQRYQKMTEDSLQSLKELRTIWRTWLVNIWSMHFLDKAQWFDTDHGSSRNMRFFEKYRAGDREFFAILGSLNRPISTISSMSSTILFHQRLKSKPNARNAHKRRRDNKYFCSGPRNLEPCSLALPIIFLHLCMITLAYVSAKDYGHTLMPRWLSKWQENSEKWVIWLSLTKYWKQDLRLRGEYPKLLEVVEKDIEYFRSRLTGSQTDESHHSLQMVVEFRNTWFVNKNFESARVLTCKARNLISLRCSFLRLVSRLSCWAPCQHWSQKNSEFYGAEIHS